MSRQILRGKILRWAAFAGGILIVTQVFFVQQLIAALLFFTAVFVCLATAALILWALAYAWRMALDRAAVGMSNFNRVVRQGSGPLSNVVVAGALARVVERRITTSK